MKKETKGITLIALVITIIVLLILAGVTISAITGNESIMEKAQSAKEKTDMSNEKEAIQLAAINSIIGESNDLKININKLKTNLSGIVEETSLNEITEEQTEYEVYGKTGQLYVINEDCEVLTIEEDIEKSIDLTITDPEAVVDDGNRVKTTVAAVINKSKYQVTQIGHLYSNAETKYTGEYTIEAYENGLIKKGSKSNANSRTAQTLDNDFGVTVRGFAIINYKGYTVTLYTRTINTSFQELSNLE